MNNKVLLDIDIDGKCIYDLSPPSSPELDKYYDIEKSPRSLIDVIRMYGNLLMKSSGLCTAASNKAWSKNWKES